MSYAIYCYISTIFLSLVYVRNLHPNLGFKMVDMRRAIGNSIRSASHEMRRLEYQRRMKLTELQNDGDIDPDERDERIRNAIDTREMALNAGDVTEYEQDQDVENEEDDEIEDEGDDEIGSLNIDENIDDEDNEGAL